MPRLFQKQNGGGIIHIFVIHGDPDHYWHADRVAKASDAPVICNKTMVRNVNGKALMLGPRDKGLAFITEFNKRHTLSIDETIRLDGMTISGIKTTHGEFILKFGHFSKTVKPDPNKRVGWGAIGFDIALNDKRIVNLGNTLLHEKEWQNINQPDVLMIPIGGKAMHNTMDVEEAVQAVSAIQPKLVIPCHYSCLAFFTKKYNPADEKMFKYEVKKWESAVTLYIMATC